MFDFLKKKITGFIDKLSGKEKDEKVGEEPEQKPDQKADQKIEEPQLVEKKVRLEEKSKLHTEPQPKPLTEGKPKTEPAPKPESKILQSSEHKKPIESATKKETKHEKTIETPKAKEKKIEEPKKEEMIDQPKKEEKKEQKKEEKKIETKEVEKLPELKKPELKHLPEKKIQQVEIIPEQKHLEQKPEEKEREVKVGIFGHLKSIFTGEVEIGKNDVREMLDSLELELIESDVALEVAESIKQELEEKLIGKKIKNGELNNFIKTAIKETLLDIISSEPLDILNKIKDYPKPVKIMFLGTNGSGKTTTIAKVAKMLMLADYKVVLAAADTFRAAAIEQLALHAERLGVKIIKRDYGGDPTAVAYDAVSYATAHGIDVVLIDTAGRQETNLNLLNEMKKMQRVIQPNIKIFIGESIAGNAITSQITEFNKEIGVDGVILTKLDCDAKGGTVLSISKVTGIPIIYLGTGQKYEDIEKFDASAVVERILS